jgi:hypothetical protein
MKFQSLSLACYLIFATSKVLTTFHTVFLIQVSKHKKPYSKIDLLNFIIAHGIFYNRFISALGILGFAFILCQCSLGRSLMLECLS